MSFLRARRFILSALKWLFTLGLLAFALRAIDREQFIALTLRQSWTAIVLSATLMIVQMAISTQRWRDVLQIITTKPAPSFRRLFNLNYISVFFNNCLPGTVGGDIVRALLLKADHVPLSDAMHSVIIDRIMALVGIVAMTLALLPWLAEKLPSFPLVEIYVACVTIALLGIALLAAAPRWLARHQHRHLARISLQFIHPFNRVALSPKKMIAMTAYASAAHISYCLALYTLAQGAHIPLSAFDCLVLLPPVMLLMMLPISIGGWGVREVSMVGFLALAGIDQETALGLSIQLGIVTIIASLPGAWLYLKRGRHA